MWNENQHGERQLLTMIINKRKLLYSRWNVGLSMDGVKEWCV